MSHEPKSYFSVMFGEEDSQKMRLLLATLFGLTGATVGCILWAVISYYTTYRIGYIAILISYLVCWCMLLAKCQYYKVQQIIAAFLSLLACLIGNFLFVCFHLASEYSVSLMEIIREVDFPTVLVMIAETSDLIDYAIYAITVWMGYRGIPIFIAKFEEENPIPEET